MDSSTFQKYIVPGEDGIAQIQIIKSDGDGAVAMCGRNTMLPLSSKAEITALLIEAATKQADIVIEFLNNSDTKTLDSVIFAIGVAQPIKGANPVEAMVADYEDEELADAIALIRQFRKPGAATGGFNLFGGVPTRPKVWPSTITYEDQPARTGLQSDVTANVLPKEQNNGSYRNGDQKKKHYHDSTSNRQNGSNTHTLQ